MPPKSELEFIALSANHGAGYALVALGGDDKATALNDVFVENGSSKFGVVLKSYQPAIWRFSGAVHRLERVIAVGPAQNNNPMGEVRSGVISVPASCVSFISNDAINDLMFTLSRAGIHTDAKQLNYILGVTPAQQHELRTPSKGVIRVPSVEMDRAGSVLAQHSASRNPLTAMLWELAGRHYPNGYIEIEPNSIVAGASARPYLVMPGLAGLAQLVERGDIEMLSTPVVNVHANLQIHDGNWKFRILRKVALPSDLYGHLADPHFVVAKGVDWPDDVLRYLRMSSVTAQRFYNEATGEVIPL